MLTKAVVFLFSILAVFGVIVQSIPSEFKNSKLNANGLPVNYSPEVVKYFSAHNITIYSNQAWGYLNYTYTENRSIPAPDPGNYLEIYWETINPFIYQGFTLKHATDQWYGRSGHYVRFNAPNGDSLRHNVYDDVWQDIITKNDLAAYYQEDFNGSLFEWSCDHYAGNILFTTTFPGWINLTQSYDAGFMRYMISYGPNLNATSMSMWTVISNLLLFRSPELGLPGVANDIIGGAVSSFMWALVAVLLYKTLTGIVPWLSGGSGD
jgi:hypothetical protein